jgi:hypothetical protein
MVDGVHVLIWNRTKKPLAIPLSGAWRGSRVRDGGGDLANVQYKPVWNCHSEFPTVKWIHPNKNNFKTSKFQHNQQFN